MKPAFVVGALLGALMAGCQFDPPRAPGTDIDSAPAAGVGEPREPARYPATLAGHVVLPYESRLSVPDDIPLEMRLAGKFTNPDMPMMTDPGIFEAASFASDPSAPRLTGIRFPVEGQPLQGFSGITALDDGTFIVLLDNGFGTRSNSRDSVLAFVRLRFHWESGGVDILEESFLHDPDGRLPFDIVNGDTDRRYLTGGDLDPESIQAVGASVFIGEEFGPFILRADFDGRITGLYEAVDGDDTIRSKSDNPLVRAASVRQLHGFSTGFEGMGRSGDGRYLFPTLEGPLTDPTTGAPESLDGKTALRILKFDTVEELFVAGSYRYLLEQAGNKIGELSFVSDHEALVIERDSGEGDMRLACGDEISVDCFNSPAKFKRIYKVSFEGVQPGGAVRKLGYINLLDIRNGDERFTFPFVTSESVVRVGENHIIVANDNNYGFSVGRTLGKNDDNEFILLEVAEFLRSDH